MIITPGTRLGPYEIVSRLGAGGMGEVWRARDTRLDRSVAVKLLAPELAGNAQLRLRFEREAKTISQLNHPHICTLFDVGEDYLVMELLEGESLSDRIARGPLPLADALRYGAQIADALDRAHRAGIVHRDLKPGNVMITKGGAKLLDFGLAKPARERSSADATTMQQRSLTEEGMIIGTFQYMAPEQLEGAEADARTDIFALGTLLYEMVTGRRAFQGKTRTSLIASIVGSEPPPIREVLPLAPASLDHVIRTCLAKDPDERWQSAHDVANQLQWIAKNTTAEVATTPRSSRWAWAAAAALAIAAIVAGALYMRERHREAPPVMLSMLPPHGQSLYNAAISPDGKLVALAASEDVEHYSVFVRHVDTGELAKVADSTGFTMLVWSPDSKSIAFVGGGKLQKVAASGGQPEVISDALGYGVGGSWSRTGDILFAPAYNASLYRVRASGGDPVRVTTLDAKQHESLHGYPLFLPDDEHFLFVRRTVAADPNEIHAASIKGGPHKLVVKADSLGGYWNGQLFFVRNGALYAQPFDEKALAVTGDPRKLLDGINYEEEWTTARVTVSNDGAIVFPPASSGVRTAIGWYDDGGKLVQKLFEETNVKSMSLSRDDSRLLLVRRDSRKGAKDVYTYDLARGVMTRVTGGLADNPGAVFSHDGSRIYYTTDRLAVYDIYSVADDGTGDKPLLLSNRDKHVTDLSPDGKTLLVELGSPVTKHDIATVSLDGGPEKPWIVTDGFDQGGHFSPDGRWVTYESDHSGRMEVYAVAFPDGRSVQVSTNGGRGAEFDADGRHIVFEDGQGMISSVEVHPSGNTLAVGTAIPLFQRPKTVTEWWRSKTTKRFLCATLVDPRDTLTVFNYVRGVDSGR